MKSHLFITKLAVQSQLWKLEIWETSQIPFIQNIHIEKKKGKKKHFQQVRLTITSLPADDCQAGIWSHVSLILTKKKNPAHTSSGVIFTSSTLRMFQPANLPPPKKDKTRKGKKRGKVPVFSPMWTIWTNVCREKGSWEQFGLKGNKGFQMSPAYSAALTDLKLEVLKVWW